MKKLLILLLLIPTLTSAEEFNLVCEGEKLSMANDIDGLTTKETIAVKVREESISIDNYDYYDYKHADSSRKVEMNYIKYDDLIRVFSDVTDTPTKKNCRNMTYTAEIDRVSGVIKTESRLTDKCMSKKFFIHTFFEGKCKKQKGNAF